MSSDRTARGPQAKGSNLLGLQWAVRSRFGPGVDQRVLDELPPDLRQALVERTVLVSGWYPLEWYKSQHRTVQRIVGEGPALAESLARMFVEQQLGSIYKALLKLISPHWLFTYPSMPFGRYFDTGTLRVVDCRAGFVRGQWSGCACFDRNLWNATWGGSRAALELAGAKNLRIEVVSGGGDGDDAAEAVGTWS